MKIAYNPQSAGALTKAPADNNITFDLSGLSIYVKGVKFKGTDTTYSVFKKHTSSSGGGYNGLVPVPSYTSTNTRFLREDGSWITPSNQYTYSALNNIDLDTLKTEGKWYYVAGGSTNTNGPDGFNNGSELYIGRNASGYRYQKVITTAGIIWFRTWNNTQWSQWKRWYTDANTDSKVLQSNVTTSNFRPIILGYNNSTDPNDLSTSVTNQVYTTTKIYAQPSTGIIHANGFYKTGSSNQKVLLGDGSDKALSDFSLTGHTHEYLISKDTRNVNNLPGTFGASARFEFKSNSTDSLNDGGTYHGILHFKPYGSTSDFSGGPTHQLAFTVNGNLWLRSGSNSTWSNWKKIWNSGNLNPDDFASSDHTHSNYVTTNTAQTISGIKTFTTQQKFTVASGTSPFTVTSTTKVTNLNADLLDGYSIGHSDNKVPIFIPFPSYTSISPSATTSDYLKGILSWVYDNYNGGASTLLVGTGKPNSKGNMQIQIYGDQPKDENGNPKYSSGFLLNLDGDFRVFGTSNYSYYEKIIAYTTSNVASATKLQTPRSINGTDFDGTKDIVTSYWGTSRNITIGNTTRAVNGSTNIVWSLSDIGVASSDHTHYWANVKVSSTANSSTSPTFANTYITGTNKIYADSTDTTHQLNLTCESTYAKIQSNGSIPLAINPDGNNVGIGITNPSYTLHVDGTLGVVGKLQTTLAGSTRNLLIVPGGEYTATTSTVTGYLKITLPVTWNSTMMKFDVFIYNYVTNENCQYSIGGYNYSGGEGSWVNISAYSNRYQQASKGNLTVRFGHDGSKCCIYIGESSTSWSYPQVVIRNVFLGFSGGTSNTWNNSWNISFTTTLAANIDSTISNPATNYRSNKADTLTTARTINGTNFDGSANITTAKWGTARSITIGDTTKSVDGSGNVAWTLSEIGVSSDSHNHDSIYVGGYKSRNHGSQDTEYTADTYSSTYVNKNYVAFAERGSWNYSGNGYITTDFGNIHLAGTSVFQWGASDTAKTQLFITPLNSSGVSSPLLGEMLYYSSNGGNYASGWTRVVTSRNYTTIITKLGNKDVGSTKNPIYLDAGIPKAISDTIGSTVRPVYLNAGTITQCNYAFGNASGNAAINNGTVCTNLNADKLDGFNGSINSEASTYVLRNNTSGANVSHISYYPLSVSPVGTEVGWYRMFTFNKSDGIGSSVIIHIHRSYNCSNNESYIFAITLAYNGAISITQLAGYANVRLITKIRVDHTNSGTSYVDFCIGNSSSCNNTYYVYGSGAGVFNAPYLVEELTGTAYEFTTVNGFKCDRGITGNITGNASGYSNYLAIHDIRDTNLTPSDCDDKRIKAWFNNTGTPNSDWWSGITVKGWTDGYAVWQLAGYSSTTSTESHLYYRRGLGTSWGSWRTILDSSNYTTYVKKLGTSTVGGAVTPIYLSSGSPTACSSSTSATANTIAVRDGNGDLQCRLVKSNFANQDTISGALAYRVSTADNYIRFCSNIAAIRSWLGVPASSHTHTLSQISDLHSSWDAILKAAPNYLSLSGGTMNSGATIKLSGTSYLIQNQNSSSNYTTILKWYKGGESQATYDPSIGQHNTGGDGTGSIVILPYATDTSPWGGSVGLFIAKNTLKLDGKSIAFTSDIPTVPTVTNYYWANIKVSASSSTSTSPTFATATMTRGVVGGYNNTSYALSTSSFICNSWVRTNGAAGWYSQTYGGGIYMKDSTYVRTYNSKKFYSEGGYHTPYTGGQWIAMATRDDIISGDTNQTTSTAHGLFRVKNSDGDAIVFGGLGKNVGFYGFSAENISSNNNSTSWTSYWDVSTGDFHSNHYINSLGFKMSGSSNSYVLLGGGSHKNLADFLLKTNSIYLGTTSVPLNRASGTLTLNGVNIEGYSKYLEVSDINTNSQNSSPLGLYFDVCSESEIKLSSSSSLVGTILAKSYTTGNGSTNWQLSCSNGRLYYRTGDPTLWSSWNELSIKSEVSKTKVLWAKYIFNNGNATPIHSYGNHSFIDFSSDTGMIDSDFNQYKQIYRYLYFDNPVNSTNFYSNTIVQFWRSDFVVYTPDPDDANQGVDIIGNNILKITIPKSGYFMISFVFYPD